MFPSSGTSTPSLSIQRTYNFYLHALTFYLGSQNRKTSGNVEVLIFDSAM